MSEGTKSYDVPDVSSIATPDEAGAALSKMDADAAGDKLHPYTNAHHPQHKNFVSAVTKLYKIKNPPAEVQVDKDGRALLHQYPPAVVKAMTDALEQQKQEQVSRTAEAQALVDELVEKHNFEPVKVTDDIPEYQLRVWKLQKLQAEGNHEGLSQAIGKELKALQAPPSVQGMFSTFCRASELDTTLREEITDRIIAWIHQANKQMFEGKKL